MVRVKVFLENRYFPEMLFSGKENVFMCLVAFQKNFRKIFSDVWLCSWKYHRKHIFYLLLTFSQLPNKHIMSFIPKITNKTHNVIFSVRSRSRSARSRSARSRSQSRRSRSRKASIAIVIDVDQRSSDDHDRDRGASVWIVSFGSMCGSEQSSFERDSACVREECVWERGGKRLKWKYGLKMISVIFGLIFGQTENIFSLTEFTMPTKHVIFRKMISEFHFQPKQTEPEC